jgi:hypothetical protein
VIRRYINVLALGTAICALASPVASANPAASWSTPISIDGVGSGLDSVSCPSSSFCVVVDSKGNAITYNGGSWGTSVTVDADGLSSVSCASATFCVAVDYNGGAATYNGSSWSMPTIVDAAGGEYYYWVSCPSASFCVVVDNKGNAVIYNGNMWSMPVMIDGGIGLASVSCASLSFCAAVDYKGNAVTYNGISWSTPISIDGVGSGLDSVSCPSSSFCAAVDGGGNAITYNGSSWSMPTTIDSGNHLTSVSCASASFCVAVGGEPDGDVEIYNDGSWSAPTSIDSGEMGRSVSCASASFCAAVDSNGDALTYSGNPPIGSGGGSPGGSPSGGTTPIPVPPTGGSCTNTPKCPPSRPQGVACAGCSKLDGAYNEYPYITVGGIYARVRNYSPWVDPGPTSYSVSAWVGLQYCRPPGGPGDCNENELAQIGWREKAYGQRDTLVEYLLPAGNFSDCNPAIGMPVNQLSCSSVPIAAQPEPYSYYTVLYGYERGKFTFYVNGRKVASAPAGFVPHQAEISGETRLVGDQMPGDANDPEIFEDINIYVNGAWQPFTPTHYSGNTAYNGADYGGYLALPAPPGRGSCLGIWDTAYGDASAAVRSICGAGAQAASQTAAISAQATQRVRSSAVVPLSCPSGTTACSGTISLNQSSGGGRVARVGAHSRQVTRPTAFALPPGGRERLRLRLTRTALRKLRTAGRLRVRAVITGSAHGGRMVSVTSRSFTLVR